MKKKIQQAIVVEGRYDAARLQDYVEATILTTDGFDIYTNPEKCRLFKRLARKIGLIILTDSDAAGFRIRNYVTNIVGAQYVRQAYIPSIAGKERRKAQPGKEGLLGVEGVSGEIILRALENAGEEPAAVRPGRSITYTDLYEWGLSGAADCAQRRREFLKKLDLPQRLSKKALLDVLNTLYSYEELDALLRKDAAAP